MMTRIVLLGGLVALAGCSSGGESGSAAAQTLHTTSIPALTGLTLTTVTAADPDGVGGVACPLGAHPVSVGCLCRLGEGAGPLFGAQVAGNGAVCGCEIGAGGPLNSPVDVSAVCLTTATDPVLDSAVLGLAPAPPAAWTSPLTAAVTAFETLRAAAP